MCVASYNCLVGLLAVCVGATMATSKKDQQSLLRVGDTVMLYYNAEKRSQEEAMNSGYIISDLSV